MLNINFVVKLMAQQNGQESSTYLRKLVPLSSVQYTSGSGVPARASKVVGDGLGATRGSFFFKLNSNCFCVFNYEKYLG